MIASTQPSWQMSQFSYALTPDEICELGSKLNYTAFKLYLYFKTQQQSGGAIRFQPDEIMERLGICRSTLRKAMTALEGLLPFRFRPIREWELQFQTEEAGIADTKEMQVVAEVETVGSLQTTIETERVYSTIVEEEEVESIDEIDENSADAYSERKNQIEAEKDWERRILEELKEKMLLSATLEELKALKRQYGMEYANRAWHLLNAEEQAGIKAIIERDLQEEGSSEESVSTAETSAAVSLQPGVFVEVWKHSRWVKGYRYVGQGDIFLQSDRTNSLELSHEIEDSSGKLLRIAESDFRVEESGTYFTDDSSN